MKMNAATDHSIINTEKKIAIFDRCVFEHARVNEFNRLNEDYVFVFPEVLLMECANAKNPKVFDYIENIEDFTIISIHNETVIPEDLIPSSPQAILKKDLRVSMVRKPEKDTNLVYFMPYDKKERIELINWAKNISAEEYYDYFTDFDKMFKGEKHHVKLEELIERIRCYGIREGKGYASIEKIENHAKNWLKTFKKRNQFNPLFGNQMIDVIGLAKIISQNTSIIEKIELLSKAYRFDSSFPIKQIEIRPNYPHPDDYAKYSYYFHFITVCSIFSGFIMDKTHLRDWQYLYYIPFCNFISADKRFFKNLKVAMKSIGTDKYLGMNISDRIHIWGEDSI